MSQYQRKYYRVLLRPSEKYVAYRHQGVGLPGKVQRLVAKKKTGTWVNQSVLIAKEVAHVEGDKLVADHPAAQEILDQIGPTRQVTSDVFSIDR